MRAVVADDHPVFRTGLRTLLEDLGVDVVAEAGDGEEALEAVRRERPDVVLMDLQMPRLGGIEATRRLLADDPDAKVLVLTMVADDEAVFAALRAGALGYLLKGAGQEEIGRALTAVAEGQAVYGADVARRVRSFFAAGQGVVARPFPELSDREREVLDLMAAGHPNAEIAGRLYLSDKTVRNYVTSVFAKLGVRDRAEAIVRAREAGLGRGAGGGR
jgi:DNA-binding NarL/FixJ family response regulator